MTAQNLKSVFLLWHVNRETQDWKLIGVYVSQSDADQAIQRLKDKPGFISIPSGFYISEYEIGKDHWSEGFGIGEE
jgi:hypothetical protein